MNEKIFVTKSSMPPFEEYIEEIRDLWDSRWLTNMGEKYEQLQAELIRYLKVANLNLLVNGHMSLEVALQALNMRKGEVITTPFTFVSTTHAIVRSGYKPVFCDIDYETYTIDVEKLRSLITNNTVAILPVHVYGNICQVEEIQKVAAEFGLKVIYDAAHAFGEEYKGNGVGTFGDMSCFSFHATKVFHTIEGGAISCNDLELSRIIKQISDFGIVDEDEIDFIGTNAKINEFSAAMGICNLRHIENDIKKRKILYERYCERLKNVNGIKMNCDQAEVKHNYAYCPVIINEKIFGTNRNLIQKQLFKYDIYPRKYFYPLTNELSCYRGKFDLMEKTPVAKYISERVLTLPLYSEMKVTDVDKICDIILKMQEK